MMKLKYLAAAALAVLVAPPDLEAASLRTSIHFPEGHATTETAKLLSERLKQATNGRLSLNIFPNSALGGLAESVDQIRTGLNDIDMAGPEIYATAIPEMQALSLPFIAGSSKQAFCIVDSDFGNWLKQKAEQKGVVVISWWSSGARHVTNNKRPIRTVEDFAGLRIRTPPNPTFLETFKLLGANAQAIDITEVYQALQQGVIDGQENPYNNTLQRKFNEVQKHLSNSGHFYAYSWILMNKKKYDALEPTLRQALLDEAAKITPDQRALADKSNTEARKKLEDGGMTFTEIAPSELAKMREKVLPLYETTRKRIGNEPIDRLLDAIKKCG